MASFAAFKAGQGKYSRHFNRLAGLLFVIWVVALYSIRLSNGFQPVDDLPLALCDIIFILCAICFWRPSKTLLTLATFWGLTGTLQAMITPDVLTAFPSREFLLFFVGHSVVIVAVFFLLGRLPHMALGGPKGVGLAFAWLLAYSFVVGAVDLAFGWNYGYLRKKPDGASLLDYLGPWPLYIVATWVMALVLFAVLAALGARLFEDKPETESS